jgi:adenosylcobinamide-GDP ribazoletransferase
MSPRLRDEAAALLLAAQFLTRIPIRNPDFTPARMAASPRYYPLVGVLVGALGAAVLLTAGAALPWTVAVLASTAATAVLTGALHEDGLADTFDGLGGATPERSLAIMRDSRLGTFGALALGLTLAAATGGLCLLGLGAIAGIAATAVAALGLAAGHALARSCFERRLGGYTGDCLGAVQQLSELGLYLGLVAWL